MSVSAKREVKVELKSSYDDAGNREARRQLRQTEREQARIAKQQAREAKAARKELLGAGRSFLGSIKDGLGLGLGFQAAGGIVGMAGDILDYEKALTRLQITADTTPEKIRAYSKMIEQASLKTGINRNEILSAGAAYVALTGDMATATASTATWAKIAAATGSTVSDIARTAAAMSQQMGIGPTDMETTFSVLAQQGKAGAIELKDLAGIMSQIAPMWGQFKGGRGVQGVRELGAALQIVKRGFGGDAGETVTGLQSLLVSFQKNAGRFKAHGIKVFDVDRHGKETMRSVFEIVDAISHSDLMKHPDQLEKALGRVEAYRALLQTIQGRQDMQGFVDNAMDAGLIQRDFTTYMESSAAKIERSWNEVKLAVASAFTPERIRVFADILTRSSDAFMRAAQWMDSHVDVSKSEARKIRSDDYYNQVVEQQAKDRINAPGQAARAVQLQNYHKGDLLPPYLQRMVNRMGGPGQDMSDTEIEAMVHDIGERLGVSLRDKGVKGSISAGMLVHQDERKQNAEGYFASIGVRAPWLGPDPRSSPGSPSAGAVAIDYKKLADATASAMTAALLRGGINVKIGSEPLVKATRNANVLNTRPGGRH